jgi:hypothetical protein
MNPAFEAALAQIFQLFQNVDATYTQLASSPLFELMKSRTKLVSLEASLSMGITNRKKKIDRIAMPFAVRACGSSIS